MQKHRQANRKARLATQATRAHIGDEPNPPVSAPAGVAVSSTKSDSGESDLATEAMSSPKSKLN